MFHLTCFLLTSFVFIDTYQNFNLSNYSWVISIVYIYYILLIHSFFDEHRLCLPFWLLWITLLWTFVYTYLFEFLFTFCHKGGVICIFEVIDISLWNLDSNLCFTQPSICMMYSAYKLNKQGDKMQPWCTPFLIWNQSVVPCPVLTVPSCPTYRFLKSQATNSKSPLTWIRISQREIASTLRTP